MQSRPAPLTASLVRRRPLLLLAPPSAYAAPTPARPESDWSGDLRYFATCYAAGLIFFLIMLS